MPASQIQLLDRARDLADQLAAVPTPVKAGTLRSILADCSRQDEGGVVEAGIRRSLSRSLRSTLKGRLSAGFEPTGPVIFDDPPEPGL